MGSPVRKRCRRPRRQNSTTARTHTHTHVASCCFLLLSLAPLCVCVCVYVWDVCLSCGWLLRASAVAIDAVLVAISLSV